HGVGLAPLPLVWRDADAQVGWLHPPPVDAGRAAGGAGAAALVRTVPADVLGAVPLAGAGELVCAGGPSVCPRPLAAPGHERAGDRRGAAQLAGQAGALAPVAAPGAHAGA